MEKQGCRKQALEGFIKAKLRAVPSFYLADLPVRVHAVSCTGGDIDQPKLQDGMHCFPSESKRLGASFELSDG